MRIKTVATEMLIRRGYRGASFGDVADALGITRANIHYHFGNKNALVEEVLDDYINSTLARFRAIWTRMDSTLSDRVEETIAFNRERHARFNALADGGAPWSLIGRMRGDSDALSPKSIASLRRFSSELAASVAIGVAYAVSRGELSTRAPIEDIVILLVSIANSAGPTTHDAASFQRLEDLYRAFLRTTIAAYGPRAADSGRTAGAPRGNVRRLPGA